MSWFTLENLKSAAEIFGAIVMLLGGIALFTKKARAFFRRLVKALSSIERIEKETTTNGGSSIKDAINRMEERLLTIEHYRKLQISNAPYGVFSSDNHGNVLDMNRKFYEMCGLSRDQCMGMGWLMGVEDNDERDCVRIALRDAINDKRETQVSFHLNGQMVTQHWFPIIDRKNVVLGLMVSTELFSGKKD